MEILKDNITGSYIQNQRYNIGRLLGEGSYGKVYKIMDMNDAKKPLAIKISKQNSVTQNEIKAHIAI